MNKIALQDCARIFLCLRAGPMTVSEISKKLRINACRINQMIQQMERRGQVYSPRCTKGSNGNPVNLWEIHPSLKPSE
ncbi:hypothetical protein HER14_03960 [Acidithiobacillus thiooxidans]|uniref:hypothetical protein n=1 Tax=Acidithiobacillus thiooxidans TaxID=930 RepID=UPI001C066764|nr:hypothetical protein [Acidithiobacillus thiooxidans]MBU2750114.1 hypothetical protein [Acidithiobacillus thiooxidans]